MKNLLAFLAVCLLGLGTGWVGFIVGLVVWGIVGQAALEVEREERKWREKWHN